MNKIYPIDEYNIFTEYIIKSAEKYDNDELYFVILCLKNINPYKEIPVALCSLYIEELILLKNKIQNMFYNNYNEHKKPYILSTISKLEKMKDKYKDNCCIHF